MTAKRYNYSDDFEMLILRHDYLNKVDNVDPQWCNEFAGIVKTTAGIMYDKLRPNFAKVGYEKEDLETVANCYMIAYMGLYSLRNNQDVRTRFDKAFEKRNGKKPTNLDIARKERINMISFLRQKLQYASIICARKARNILVDADKKVVYAATEDSVPASEQLIFERGEELGYRKVQQKELKEIKQTAKENKTTELKDENGFIVIEIEVMSSLAGGLSEGDYRDLFLEDKTDHFHVNPEEALRNVEDDVDMANIIDEFFNMSKDEKRGCLTDFIDLYKGNKYYRDELRAARKMLRNL